MLYFANKDHLFLYLFSIHKKATLEQFKVAKK